MLDQNDSSPKKNWFMRLVSPRLGKLWQYAPKLLTLPSHYHKKSSLKTAPLITIVTPSYNQKAFVGRTIESVLSQDYPRLEYIVQDGGSNDGSVEVIKSYESQLTRWASHKDKGQGDAINLGFQGTTGDIMGYLNSDDLLLPGTLNYVASYFEKHPAVDVVYGHRIQIDENDAEVGRWVLPPHSEKALKWIDFIPQETMFWRRSIWEKAGGKIDDNFQFALDWDLILRFQKAGAKMVRLPRFLGAFRVHSNQKTLLDYGSTGTNEIEKLRQRELGYLPSKKQIKSHIYFYVVKHIIYDRLHRWGLLRH